MTWQLSNFVIGLTIVSLCSIGLGLFIVNVAENDSITDVDAANVEEYNHLTELTTLSNDLKTTSNQISNQEDAIDTIGSLVSSGFNAFKVGLKSINVFIPIVSNAIDSLPLGPFIPSVKSAVITIVLFTLIVGVLFTILFKVYT